MYLNTIQVVGIVPVIYLTVNIISKKFSTVQVFIFTELFPSFHYSPAQKNQTKPPFFHACHSYTLIKFEYFSRQKSN